MKNKIIGIIVAVLVIAGAYVVVQSTNDNLVSPVRYGGTSNLTALTLSAGLTTGGIVSTSTATSTGAVLAQSNFYLSTGELTSVISFTPVGSSTQTQSLALPASSTLTTLVPNAGDTYSVWIINASSTGAVMTVSGGTGTTLKNASSSAAMAGGSAALLTFQRLVNKSLNVYIDLFR